ncbi:PAS domain-containing sensor histidine kinase [Sphingomonas sp. HDW15A]|uniref:sensor histidine kinase n=1 Tax=Sphingomonas sp. HDW15A TaxID=2714942 RepID=UPI00140D2107|nr:HAMP domain-containing sensor histidine kinase [Sphingomonas sp. HDW15A]QIK95736.1 PAS domain-containing sensor histidine kinase [Sphingomonas sp. HDW15A]
MASAAGNGDLVCGRVDSAGRLVEADSMLGRLQQEAGARVGERLMLPQLAAVARLVRKLGIAVARPAVVAGRDYDVELWVRGEPDGDDVLITIESWRRRPPQGPRLEQAARGEDVLPATRGEWATDSELRITELSPDLAELLGVGIGEASGQPLTRLVRLLEGEDGAMPMLLAVASRASFSDQRAASRSGQSTQLVLEGTPVLAADGSFAGYRGRALPEHKAKPAAANEAGPGILGLDPALDHALRSPIDRIIRAAEGIAERSEGPLRSDYAAYAGDIAAAARHLLSVIRSMVDQPPELQSQIDLGASADEAFGLVEAEAEERSVVLQREGAQSLDAVGDPRAVIQILVNLLANAVRHSPIGGKVILSLVAGTDFASACISDEGPGIAPADQERIFERFEQAQPSGGAGLGLAIARRLARSMGGDITLVSAPGEGARFTLSLPLAR